MPGEVKTQGLALEELTWRGRRQEGYKCVLRPASRKAVGDIGFYLEGLTRSCLFLSLNS